MRWSASTRKVYIGCDAVRVAQSFRAARRDLAAGSRRFSLLLFDLATAAPPVTDSKGADLIRAYFQL